MKQAGVLIAVLVLVIWMVWNLWNLFRILGGLRDGTWRRPMWWTRLCSVALFAGLASWIRGVFSGGLDIGEKCQFVYRQPYDEAYWDAHAEQFQKLFPLHNKCNEHFDMVPAWVNPAIVTCAGVALIAAAVLLWFGTSRLTSLLRKENPS